MRHHLGVEQRPARQRRGGTPGNAGRSSPSWARWRGGGSWRHASLHSAEGLAPEPNGDRFPALGYRTYTRRRRDDSNQAEDAADRDASARTADAVPTLPLMSSLKGYRPEWLRYDITAGLAIAAVGLPSAIAYPALAGLPPEVGLYASILAVLGYALFGSSRQLIVGPDAGTVMMLGAAFVSLGVIVDGRPHRRVRRHRPDRRRAVLPGQPAAARLHRQLPVAADPDRLHDRHLAVDPGRPDRPLHRRQDRERRPLPAAFRVRPKVGQIHWPSLALGVGLFVLLRVLGARGSGHSGTAGRRGARHRPVVRVRLPGHGIRVVGEVPSQLPSPIAADPAGRPDRRADPRAPWRC